MKAWGLETTPTPQTQTLKIKAQSHSRGGIQGVGNLQTESRARNNYNRGTSEGFDFLDSRFRLMKLRIASFQLRTVPCKKLGQAAGVLDMLAADGMLSHLEDDRARVRTLHLQLFKAPPQIMCGSYRGVSEFTGFGT